MNMVLTLIGSFVSILLIANGFFLKSILSSQNIMQVEIGKLLVKVENFSGRIDELEHNLRKLELTQIECRGKCEYNNPSMRH